MSVKPVASMGYKVDWFQCTESSTDDTVLNLLDSNFWYFLTKIGYKFSDLEESKPRFFYNSGLTLGRYLNIFYDDEDKEINQYSPKNICFQFTGQGSTDLALKLGKYLQTDDFDKVWTTFFKVVMDCELKVTRLDIALDDYKGVLAFSKLERKLQRREIRASKRSFNIVKERSTDGTVKGETIYLGTRKRHQDGYLIRFYNKYAEYKSKGDILPTVVENEITGEGTHVWQRYEIEIHGSACKNFILKILGGMSFGELYKGLMKNAVEFLKVSRSNKNRAYWPVVDWWSDFLEDAEKTSLAEPNLDVDLGRLLRWIRKSVTPSLKLIADVFEQRGLNVYELIENADIPEYSKKQERLKNEALDMSDKEFNSYVEQFKRGEY